MPRQFNLIKWSLRKITLPIYGNSFNLEVGSGGNPHPMADVLLEKFVDDTHRLKSIKIDRPMILSDASKMPFKDKAFDFIFAYHVLEHVHDPGKFLDELQRVGKRGYIETPNALYERVNPIQVHLLEIFHLDNKLYIYKKNGPKGEDFISNLKILEKDKSWKKLFSQDPRMFHCCYLWDTKIHYEIINPDVKTDWFVDPDTIIKIKKCATLKTKTSLRSTLIDMIKNIRKKEIDLDKILVCPECKSELARKSDYYQCLNKNCSLKFSNKPIPDFNNPL